MYAVLTSLLSWRWGNWGPDQLGWQSWDVTPGTLRPWAWRCTSCAEAENGTQGRSTEDPTLLCLNAHGRAARCSGPQPENQNNLQLWTYQQDSEKAGRSSELSALGVGDKDPLSQRVRAASSPDGWPFHSPSRELQALVLFLLDPWPTTRKWRVSGLGLLAMITAWGHGGKEEAPLERWPRSQSW